MSGCSLDRQMHQPNTFLNINGDPVVINISGTVYHLKRGTFRRLPPSCLEKAIKIESDVHEEYYIEGHAQCFSAILWYFTHGELHMPTSVCPAVFSRELQFWKIDPKRLSRCCNMRFISFFSDQALLKSMEEVETKNALIDKGIHLSNTKWERFRKKVWDILDDPTSSTTAKAYVGISACFIIISIFVLCASTHPAFQRELEISEWKEYYKSEPGKFDEMFENKKVAVAKPTLPPERSGNSDSPNTKVRDKTGSDESQSREISGSAQTPIREKRDSHDAEQTGNKTMLTNQITNFNKSLPTNLHSRYHFLDIVDYVMVTYFSLEFALRLLFCPVKRRFFKSILNIVDIVALSSECLIMIFETIFPKERFTSFSLLDIVECIQIARVFRLFRLIKNFIGFRVLVYSIKASFANMMLMVFLLMVAALIFSTSVFYLDRDQFPSIPDAIWWAIITMTTVGYGDMHPGNMAGKIIGCLCAVSGVFVLAVLIPVLVTNFLLFIGFARIPQRDKDGLASMVRKEYEIREFHNTKAKVRVQLSCP
ncbi:potassium voltage-gated channel protein egl-36-like [Pecten maximus]|uniref:potassium voltage-gated channel protein egl-36-like n=1 Tax=Pecten maximus TaxID=6579 RepID=UPI00145864DF|nr:potassium voltage-gated channel protein egl-36-like [Pecten maximus]